jgi:hypothetical protein
MVSLSSGLALPEADLLGLQGTFVERGTYEGMRVYEGRLLVALGRDGATEPHLA